VSPKGGYGEGVPSPSSPKRGYRGSRNPPLSGLGFHIPQKEGMGMSYHPLLIPPQKLVLHSPRFGVFPSFPVEQETVGPIKTGWRRGLYPSKNVLNPKKWYCGFRTPKRRVWGGRTIPFLPKKGVQGVP